MNIKDYMEKTYNLLILGKIKTGNPVINLFVGAGEGT